MARLIGIGRVTNEEKNRIKELHFRGEALRLISAVADSKSDTTVWLRNRANNDLVAVERLFQAWWDEMSHKYDWPGTQWKIDFETNDILAIGLEK